MQNFTNEDDLIQMRGEGLVGMPVPENLHHLENGQLVFDGSNLLDVSTITDWLIDDDGHKRHPDIHVDKDWQAMNCNFDDVLIVDGDLWRLETDADRLAAAKARALENVVVLANGFTSGVLAKYPVAERQGWPQKQAECEIIAAADKAGTNISTALGKTKIIKAIATTTSWDDATIVATAKAVIAKADEFSAIAAMVEVMRNQAEVAINAAGTLDELETTKLGLMQQANVLAQQYGLA